MTKLHQILAVESGIRTQTQADLAKLHTPVSHHQLLLGQTRTYTPLEEDGEKIPPERALLQVRLPSVLAKTAKVWEKLLDVTATRDFANCDAKADVKLDNGTVILKQAPATYLLWLEKKLQELHSFICSLPLLPPEIEWVWDKTQNCFRNKEAIVTTRTAKVFYAHQLAPATPEHPAQVNEKSREQVIGHYHTLRFCGAFELETAQEMKGRVEELFRAVKFAREEANRIDVVDQKVGKGLLSYIFGDNAKG